MRFRSRSIVFPICSAECYFFIETEFRRGNLGVDMVIVVFDVTETCFNIRTGIENGLGRIVEIILDKSTHKVGLLSYHN